MSVPPVFQAVDEILTTTAEALEQIAAVLRDESERLNPPPPVEPQSLRVVED